MQQAEHKPSPFLSSQSTFSSAPPFQAEFSLRSPKLLNSKSLPAPRKNGRVFSPPSPLDLDFNSSLAYTSLKDVLPSSPVNSPTPTAAVSSAYDISIRNRLLKQAAWAYLRPMSGSQNSSETSFFRRLWLEFPPSDHVSSCIRFVRDYFFPSIAGIFDRISRFFRF
ncbi:hypothetical protein K2173_012130 [Erythroxylum novogranatense]|uniref:Uncharacterized protein n=1 Tax=Erythroxylum novogranatense TaxID=1862640 RepID=A0AAV8SRU6_9ROSI|nr:hypothetical protein K2173_012130 [Erythroxylum novogranatense]